MLKEHHNMPERKNFLLLAIGMGAIGIIIGVVTIWNMATSLFNP
jgi:hypothetical protein